MLRLDADSLFLAIDAGTTNIKTAIVDRHGKILDLQSESVKIVMPFPGACEMDMNSVWQKAVHSIHTLKNRNKEIWKKICAVGVCAQGDGAWPVDSKGNPVRDAILWNDTRRDIYDGFSIDDVNALCLAYHTTPLFPGAAPVLVRWIKRNEPESYRKIYKVLHCKDWINYRLTGRMVTDVTDASTALLNLYTKKYEYRILDSLDISEAGDMFPEAVASNEKIGVLTKKAAEETGIAEGVPVIAGAIDVLAVASGCGMTETGQKGSIIGTTLCNYVVLDEQGAKETIGGIGSVLCHTKKNTYIRLMASLSGASSLDWVRREILREESFAEIEKEISRLPCGSGGVMYHPYLYGERAPFRDPQAAGGFYGIRSYHTRYHLVRAAYEGVVLSMYDCYQSLPNAEKELCVAGGAAKSDILCQMVSDCMGERVARYSQKELGILGIYCLLCDVFGLESQEKETERVFFFPDEEKRKVYQRLYIRFQKLREAMQEDWNIFSDAP